MTQPRSPAGPRSQSSTVLSEKTTHALAGPLIILIPVFNDWTALDLLLAELDGVLEESGPVHIVIVDDGSTVKLSAALCGAQFSRITTVSVVHLRRNLGHQRAISVGLVYVYETYPGAVTVVMDGDGEDKPADVNRLIAGLKAEQGCKIVFAERAKRTESLVFQAFYHLYRLAHYLLTGISVRVGNFSVIPYTALSSLTVTSETWNHYAAAVYSARLPHTSIPTARGVRLSGRSHMNFISFVIHGLSAISVYSDRVGVRLLALSALMIFLVIAALLGIVLVRVYTVFAIPGWASYVTGLLVIILIQSVLMSFIFAFISLNSRSRPLFLPLRDCPYFVASISAVYPKA